MKLIVGLGNPGKEYENTRHNIGFIVLDNIIKNNWKTKNNSLVFEDNINGEKIIFVKPLTYMNESGKSVYEFTSYYNIPLQDILIIHDDLDLPTSSFRLKKDSGDGGHNGIKSIISMIGTKDFARLKIGISNNKLIDTKDYVTGHFSKEELELINKNMDTYINIIKSFINDGLEKTMNIYNTKES